jgi:hypothetical protein
MLKLRRSDIMQPKAKPWVWSLDIFRWCEIVKPPATLVLYHGTAFSRAASMP